MDDYDMDEIDDEMDEDYEDDFNDEMEDDDGDTQNLSRLEELGLMDGQQDAISGSFYTGYGLSVDDFENLSDEERDAYEMGYHTGFGAGGGWG